MTVETPIQRLDRIFSLQKAAFANDMFPSAEARIERMSRVAPMMLKNRRRIQEAMAADFGSHSALASDMIEILSMFERVRFNCENVRAWMQPVPKFVDAAQQGESVAYVQHSPKGVICNMVAWNFPFDVGIGPVIDMLGAGNRAIIKPSELNPHCGALMQEMFADSFAEDEVAVVNGGLDLARHCASLPWDHLVFTGGTAIGREVMKACAQNLVPVTLELGGRNPTVVGPDKLTDPQTLSVIAGIKAVKRGQMCVTVDHLLVPENGLDSFVAALADVMRQGFAHDNGAGSACGIISERHLARLNDLVEDARARGAQVIRIGGDMDPAQRDMPFYLIVNPGDDARVVNEEIFGPILPILAYKDIDDLIARIQRGDLPLAIYAFTDDPALRQAITTRTRSGGVCFNAAALQAAQASMGFGGVGASGMGRHHGEEGFREFSNPRGFYERRAGGILELSTPPYSDATREMVDGMVYPQLAAALGIEQ
ncbi:MAG: aldehyde dehydrogenase family protein [Burkholderiaceae bacterium]